MNALSNASVEACAAASRSRVVLSSTVSALILAWAVRRWAIAQRAEPNARLVAPAAAVKAGSKTTMENPVSGAGASNHEA
jgi:predicted metal-binding membrane protein